MDLWLCYRSVWVKMDMLECVMNTLRQKVLLWLLFVIIYLKTCKWNSRLKMNFHLTLVFLQPFCMAWCGGWCGVHLCWVHLCKISPCTVHAQASKEQVQSRMYLLLLFSASHTGNLKVRVYNKIKHWCFFFCFFTRDGHYEIKPAEVNHLEAPSKLKWNLTNKVKEVIQQSSADLDRWAVRHVSLSFLYSLW